MISRTPPHAAGSSGGRSMFSLRDGLHVMFRHKKKMAAFFVVTLTLVMVGVVIAPRSYQSEARLFVRLGKESVSLDPTATLGQTVNVDGTRESEINSELEILRSRVLLEDVIERLGVETVLGTSSPADSEGGWLDTLREAVASAKSVLTGEIGPEERAINQLETMLWVSVPRKSSVIALGCRAANPALAQQILKAFLEAYSVRHGKANRNPGSYEFFVDQSNLVGQQLEKATEELRDAKNESGLVSIQGHRQSVQAQADAIELARLENQRALASSEAKIAALKLAFAELPPQLVAEETAGMPNMAADVMRNELYKLQILEKDASARYTPNHPQVLVLRGQVAETQRIFDDQETRRSQTTRKLSEVHQGVHSELMAAQALAASQQADAKAIEQQFEAIQTKIRTLNEKDFHITQLTRRAELLENNFRTYSNNREQARIDQALETSRVSNVNVIQPASFAAKPVSPRVQILLLLGLVLATVGAVLLAIVAEYLDRSVKTPEQLESDLNIPVLLAVPHGASHDLVSN